MNSFGGPQIPLGHVKTVIAAMAGVNAPGVVRKPKTAAEHGEEQARKAAARRAWRNSKRLAHARKTGNEEEQKQHGKKEI